VILLDSDVLLIDRRYQNDPRYPVNRQAIEFAQTNAIALAMTGQVLLEVVGVLSFNVSPSALPGLPSARISLYGLTVRPEFQTHPDYAGCTVAELMVQMASAMALGDAVQAIQIARYASDPTVCSRGTPGIFKGKSYFPSTLPRIG